MHSAPCPSHCAFATVHERGMKDIMQLHSASGAVQDAPEFGWLYVIGVLMSTVQGHCTHLKERTCIK